MIATRRSLLCALLLGVGALSGAAAPKEGDPAPNFTAETVDGKKISLAEYRGKSGVILNFYANF